MARLWLLRGIASHCRGDAARADLERAALFVTALRVDEDAVHSLLLLGATRVQAVAALRRAEGHADKAATNWFDSEKHRSVAQKEREEQRRFGQAADGSFVDMQLLEQLQVMGIERKLAAAALRQSNNDLNGALEAIRTQPADVILGKRIKADAKKQPSSEGPPIDEVALASLLSLGFPRAAAEEALRASNGDFEEAVLLASAGTVGAEQPGNDAVAPSASAPEGAAEPAKQDSTENEAEQASSKDSEDGSEGSAGNKADDDRAYQEARELIERELGDSLRRSDIDEDVAGASLVEEEQLLQQFGIRTQI